MFTGFLARRHLKSSRENRFFSWVSFLSISGVAIGVAAPIVVLSVIGGFQQELSSRFLAANAHVLAYKFPNGIENHEEWEKTMNKDFAKAVSGTSPFIHYETLGRNGSNIISILVRGISPTLREKVQTLHNIVNPVSSLDLLQKEVDLANKGDALPEVPSVILGSGVLKKLELKVGDTINLVSPAKSSMDSLKPFKIVGTYDSGFHHYDNKLVLMSVPSAQVFFGMGDKVTGIEVGLTNPDKSIGVANAMRKKYRASQIVVKPWQTFNSPLFDAMKKEKGVIAVIVFLVIGVASFNILTTLFIAVSQKQREISILKAIGATNRQILQIFVKQGFYTGVIGSILGLIIATALCKFLQTVNIIDLPELYLLARLPVNYDWTLFAGVTFAGMAICTLAGIPPAYVASKVNPTDGFRRPEG